MNDPRKVQAICRQIIDTGRPRNENYALINNLYNGASPWTPDEARADHQHTNVNWLEGTEKLHEARSQARNALKSTENYFTVKLDTGPVHYRGSWETIITKKINRFLKRSRAYGDVIDASINQMVLHGIGPSNWLDRSAWCPKARNISEMLIPTETLTSLENLNHFAIRITFTVAELIRQTKGQHVDKGWNIPMVDKAIAQLKITLPGNTQTDFYYDPVAMVEDWKQNGAWYNSDAVPVLRAFDFYYLDAEQGKWHRQIVVDCEGNSFQAGDYNEGFLYDNKDLSFGADVSNILHCQIADGAVVAPSKWHSVRSLGYLLYPICQSQNRLRCKFMDSVWESMLWYFRNVSDADREVIQKVDLRHLGVIPNGLSFVPSTERHNINFELVSGQLAMNRQLMSENSASFTQGVNDGTSKEMTATETMARLSAANKLQNSILSNIYEQQVAQYREISRRFCVTDHPDCKKFRDQCMAEGVDPAVFDVECWEVTPERTTGGGDRMMQIAIADKLMELSPRMSPKAQNEVLHIAVEAISGEADMANSLVPLDEAEISSSAEKATLSWGTLIDNKPVVISGDVNRIEFAETLLKMLDMEFKRINLGNQGPPSMERLQGIDNVVKTIAGVVQQIATDENQGERVKSYMNALGKAQNYLKAYVQQIQQQQEAQVGQNGQDPALGAEVASKLITAKSDAQIEEAKAAQKLRHKELAFAQDQARKDVRTTSDISNMASRLQVELAGQEARQQAKVDSQNQP